MKKIIFLFVLVLFTLPAMLHADWDQKEVKKVQRKLKEGDGFFEWHSYPDTQVISLKIRDNYFYLVDLKAKFCFVNAGMSTVPVSCKAIKRGYPIVAPLITWVK